MAATKLSVYNNALYILGERRLANEFEDREPRFVLDEIANLEAYGVCLEIVKPRFAVSSIALTSPATSSVHGLDNVYTFPADYISTLGEEGINGINASFFADEDFEHPIDRYIIEGRTVACDVATTIYMRYITGSRSLSQWTPMFGKLVAAYIAREASSRINPSRMEYANAQFEQALDLVVRYEGLKENPIIPQAAAAPLSADQLIIYNLVANELGRAEMRYVGDESGLRLAIDNVYEMSQRYLLELIKPKFSTRVAELAGGSVSSVHGIDNVFSLPADYQAIVSLWSDDKLSQPITRFLIEDSDIAIDNFSTAYLRYVSNSSTEADWAPSFTRALATHIAGELSPRFAPELTANLFSKATERIGVAIQLEGYKEPLERPLVGTVTLSSDYLELYNKALEILELPYLVNINDESERKVALDYALNNKCVETVFELISWGLLYKTVKILKDDAVSPDFGFQYAFDVPDDMIRIDAMSADEYFRHPMDYTREGDRFFADQTIMYLRYLSEELVQTPSLWPTYMFNLVAAELARRCKSLTGANRDQAEARYKEYKYEAYNTDAQRNPPQVITDGSWTRARQTWQRRRTERP